MQKPLSVFVLVVVASVSALTIPFIPQNPLSNLGNSLAEGLTVPDGNGVFKLGTISIPIDFLAKDSKLTSAVVCHLCYFDCLSVHNRYGGALVQDSRPNATPNTITCACVDDQPANQTLSVYDHCPALVQSTDGVTDAQMSNVLVIREHLLLCPSVIASNGSTVYDNTGCNADCINNHQYNGGACGVAPSIPETPQQSQSTQASQLFCNCSY